MHLCSIKRGHIRVVVSQKREIDLVPGLTNDDGQGRN
jgi:hypothetical protein